MARTHIVTVVAGAWLLVSPASHGAPAESPAKPAQAKGAAALDPESARTKLETGIAEIGKIEEDVREEGNPRRLACVVDKRERAGRVLERATDDMLVYRDRGSDERTRKFAAGKLAASAERMTKLVNLARDCKGLDRGGRPETDEVNTASEPSQVPQKDPTKGTPDRPGVPPPFDPNWGPVASAVR